jgi:hypothetical protein
MIVEGEPLRTAEGPSKLDEAKETIQSAADMPRAIFGGQLASVKLCPAFDYSNSKKTV